MVCSRTTANSRIVDTNFRILFSKIENFDDTYVYLSKSFCSKFKIFNLLMSWFRDKQRKSFKSQLDWLFEDKQDKTVKLLKNKPSDPSKGLS